MTQQPLSPGLEDFSGDREFLISLSRGFQLLRAFRPEDPPLGNRELSARTGLPKATVSRLVYTLMALGYLNRDTNNRYTLGAGVLTLAHPMLASMRIRQIARPWVEQLARATRSTVHLVLREGLCAVSVESFSLDRRNRWRPDVGTQIPLLTTAGGCAVLVASTSDEQQAVLNRLRLQDPERFERELPIWERERDAFARVGFCSSYGVWRSGVHGLAVPLRQEIQPGIVALNCTRVVRAGAGGSFAVEASEPMLKAVREIELACARKQAVQTPPHDRLLGLSPREREVFELLVAGLANHQIADALGINQKTVSTHKSSLMKRLGVDNLAALIRVADLL